MRTISIVFILSLLAPPLTAQITPVSIEERVAEATLIVEAEVLDAQSFWDSRRHNIHTSHRLRVFKVFKGNLRTDEIELLTLGGVVGTQGQHTSHVLRIERGDIGLFLCTPTEVGGSPRGFPPEARMQSVAAEQGFLRYSGAEQTATDPFVDYGGIEAQLYPLIVSLTGRPWTVKAERASPPAGGSFGKGGGGHGVTALGITSLTGPHPAGNRTLLTITGTDFGNTTGKVRFVSADNNSNHYFDALPAEIVSWSSTQIEVYVPPGAGTGKVRVVTATPVDSVDSASDLTVPYSRSAATYNNDHWTTDHVDMNGNGGYTWQLNTTFAGTAARKTAFVDQLEIWRCATTTNRVNWDIGRDTTLAVIASDGVNLALMGGLPPGVLGRCTSYYYISTCSPDTIAWLYELDIAFSTAFSWEYTGTPASGVYDFRSVALHELGHGMQIGHAKNSAQVMYYAISAASMKRTLHTNDVAAGQDAMDASVAANPCGGPPITAQSANAGPDRNLCAGSSVTLTAQGGTAYEWTIPPSATVVSTAPSYTVSPATTTTYRVSVTSGSCVSASTDDVTVSVRATPTADAGSDVGICPSGSAAIGSAGVSATNYTSTGSGTAAGASIMFQTGSEDNRTQLLFTVTELNALGFSAGIITDLAFSIAGSSTASQAMNNFNVRIAHTSATDLSTGFRSAAFTTVYSSAAYTPSGTGWQNLDLIPWFRWNGLDNLLVEVCFDNSSSTTDYALNFTTHGSNVLSAFSTGTGSGCSLPSQYVSTARPLTRFTIASEVYSWSPATGLTSPYVANPTASPATTTTYTLTVTSQYGCEDSDQVTVTVHPADPVSLTWTGAVNTDWSTIGNWDNPCAIPTSGDAVTIPASTTPPSGVPALTLGSLALDNSGGITLGNAMSITGTLALTNGSITLGNNDLTIGASGSISGGSSGSHVVTNGSGMLIQQNIGSGGRSGSVLFPVATTTTYTPATLLNAGTADIFRVRVSEGVLDGGTTGTPLAAHAVAKTWIIEEASAGGSDATVTLQWNSGDELSLFDRSNSFVAKHNGTSWTPLQSAAAASGSGPYTRSVAGVASFSPFGVGDGASALPVELTSFHALLTEGKVKLSWTTATEVNNYGFTVERRTDDASPWEDIGFVTGAGTRNTPTTYSHVDNQIPAASSWVYRLRQRDRDGSEHLSPEVEVQRLLPDAFALSAPWPQPSSDAVNIRVSILEDSPLTLRIHDLRGAVMRTVHDAPVSRGMHVFRTGTNDLRSGSYVIVATTPTGVRRVRLVVLR